MDGPIEIIANSTDMDISTVFNSLLTWFADHVALFSNPLSATIGFVAIVPLLIAMMMRDGTATLVTALFALGAILLCATQESDWTLCHIPSHCGVSPCFRSDHPATAKSSVP